VSTTVRTVLTARVLGPVMEYNAAADPVRHARIAQGLGVDISGLSPLDAAVAGVDELYRLTDVGIPTMEALGFSEDEIPMLARIAFEDPQTIGNAREVDVAAYEDIYRNAFHGARLEHLHRNRLLHGDRRSVGRVGVRRALRGNKSSDRREPRHGARRNTRGRAARHRRRKRGQTGLGVIVGLRARRSHEPSRRSHRGTAR
jgi:hypothetical protein